MATPLIKDIYNIQGNLHCQIMSCVDIKDAYRNIRLNPRSKEFCGILPYFGSQHYGYEVLPMGLGTSPAIWMTHVNFLLDSMPDKEKVIAIMDDLLIHSSRRKHFQLIENLLITMKTNGLKLSPKKNQLFMMELINMGTLFKVQGDVMTITPLCTCIEAIQKLKAPTTVKGCKSFCNVVNYLALFCPELQKLLHPIYDLTRKGVEFYRSEQHQANFDEIKCCLCCSPVLHLPISGGRFILYNDTSRTLTGSAMWQFQKGKPCLIGYASKSLPPTCKNYSVMEL